MEVTEQEIGGRKYRAYSDGSGNAIIVGPPEGLVDELKLPEPFATTLHNVLYSRGLFTYREVAKKPKELIGALQEALNLDAQKLQEMYFRYTQEVHDDQ